MMLGGQDIGFVVHSERLEQRADSSTGLPQSILGDVFLKAVFAVFDSEGPQFGWAPKQL